jgi:hypothetical protein
MSDVVVGAVLTRIGEDNVALPVANIKVGNHFSINSWLAAKVEIPIAG